MAVTSSSLHSPQTSSPAPVVTGSGTPRNSGRSNFSEFSWQNPLLAIIVVVVAALGIYLIVGSSAATIQATKVWSTAADWGTGTLTGTAVIGNSVSLTPQVVTSNNSNASTVNLALRRPAYASSSSSTGKRSELSAKYVDDGSLTTRWSSKYSDPQYIYVDLGKSYKISEVKLFWQEAYARAYQIQTSADAHHWTTIYSTITGRGGVNDLTDLTASGRYVRMYGTKRSTTWGYSLWEMQVFGPSGGVTTPTTTTTYPSSGTITLPFDAGSSVTWTSLARQATTASGTAISYEVRSSNNNSTWSAWYTVPSDGSLSGVAASRYLQIRATLTSNNTNITPILTQLALDYNVPVTSPTVSLSAAQTQITAGQSTTLSWNSTNTSSCTASGGWSGAEAPSGSTIISPTATTTYNLSCTGSGGTVSATPVTVTVTSAPSSGGGGGGGGGGSGTVLFNGDFSSGTLTGSRWLLQACSAPTTPQEPPQGVTLTTNPAPPAGSSSQYVGAFTVADNSTSAQLNPNNNNANCATVPTANPRAQLVSPYLMQNGSSYYVGFSTYFPSNFPIIPSWFQIAEVYGPPFGGSPAAGIGVKSVKVNGTVSNVLFMSGGASMNYATYWSTPLVENQWQNIVWHINMSTDPNVGYLELWLNGVQQQFVSGSNGYTPNLANNNTRMYFSTLVPGVNWDGHTPNDLTINQYRDVKYPIGTVTIYHAAAKIGTTYNSVLP